MQKLAMRADPPLGLKFGLGSGSVAIVLDCSGSMRAGLEQCGGHRGLYPVAVEGKPARRAGGACRRARW